MIKLLVLEQFKDHKERNAHIKSILTHLPCCFCVNSKVGTLHVVNAKVNKSGVDLCHTWRRCDETVSDGSRPNGTDSITLIA